MGTPREKNLPVPPEWRELLEATREARGLRRGDVTSAAGLAPSAWTQIMTGIPSWHTVIMVAQVMDLPLPRLYTPGKDDAAEVAIAAEELRRMGELGRLRNLLDAARAELAAARALRRSEPKPADEPAATRQERRRKR